MDRAGSCFVGDADGRVEAASYGRGAPRVRDSDRRFAEAVGVPFFSEQEFFTQKHPQ